MNCGDPKEVQGRMVRSNEDGKSVLHRLAYTQLSEHYGLTALAHIMPWTRVSGSPIKLGVAKTGTDRDHNPTIKELGCQEKVPFLN